MAGGREERFYSPGRQCDMTHSWSLYIWDLHETLGGIIGTNNLLLHWKINVSLIKTLVKASVWKIFLRRSYLTRYILAKNIEILSHVLLTAGGGSFNFQRSFGFRLILG